MKFRDTGQPRVLTVTFWAVYAVMLAGGAVSVRGLPGTALFALTMVLVAGLWLVMPAGRDAGAARKLAAPGLLVVVPFAGEFVGGLHSAMLLIAMVHVAFLYGMRVAVRVVCAYVAAMGAVIAVLSGGDWGVMAEQIVLLVLFAVFSLAMAAALIEARTQREAAQRLIERIRELAVAEERARMARDMHDSIGHQLTLIKMSLENAERFRLRRPEAVWEEVGQAKEVTAQALAESRRWARALRPLALDGHVGSGALERLARSFDGTGVEVGFQVEGAERRIDPDAELVLYRVLQEGLTNVLRHAGARRVRARLAYGEDRVALTIGDDGRGTSHTADKAGAAGATADATAAEARADAADATVEAGAEARADVAGFGLSSLAERVRGLGGAFRAGDADGGGFELHAEVPVMRR
ncbi:signal transduction histidine kinase [Nonomuraea thailandensis]|uniref:Signal transduction histidine kinase n=1 Tax=Nonomuraea thailandensis TaxID=1188745 RepID=A0A9X2H2R8_9ACTN|nr:sensor histidine kinase [Nonomuraea thailandensis]MCP2364918.1 signal transduction histidine kinase [Nonomuraea thailandensis]